MKIKNAVKYGLSLMLLLMSLSACSCKINYEYCPVYPVGGQKVGRELEKLNEAEFQATFEWIARINKLRLELEECKKDDFHKRKSSFSSKSGI